MENSTILRFPTQSNIYKIFRVKMTENFITTTKTNLRIFCQQIILPQDQNRNLSTPAESVLVRIILLLSPPTVQSHLH